MKYYSTRNEKNTYTAAPAMAMGLAPGPALGRVLARLTEEVMDEKLPNEREALLRRAAEIKEESL